MTQNCHNTSVELFSMNRWLDSVGLKNIQINLTIGEYYEYTKASC